jgi:hypothetical protein
MWRAIWLRSFLGALGVGVGLGWVTFCCQQRPNEGWAENALAGLMIAWECSRPASILLACIGFCAMLNRSILAVPMLLRFLFACSMYPVSMALLYSCFFCVDAALSWHVWAILAVQGWLLIGWSLSIIRDSLLRANEV